MSYRYSIKVCHTALGKYRVVTGNDEYVVKAKARALRDQWDFEYEIKAAKERKEAERELQKTAEERKRQSADDRNMPLRWSFDPFSHVTTKMAALRASQDVLCIWGFGGFRNYPSVFAEADSGFFFLQLYKGGMK